MSHTREDVIELGFKMVSGFWGKPVESVKEDPVGRQQAERYADRAIQDCDGDFKCAIANLKDEISESEVEGMAARDFEDRSYGRDIHYERDDECDHGYADEYMNRGE